MNERQQRTEEENRQEQTDEDEEGGKSRLETRVRELEARLRGVEERVYDETMSGQASAQGGQQTDEENEHWQRWRGRWWMRIDRGNGGKSRKW